MAGRQRQPVNASSSSGPSSPSRVIAAMADLALFIGPDGVVRDVSVGDVVEPHKGWKSLIGKPWTDTVTVESRNKVELLLKDARDGRVTSGREINQQAEGLGEIPFRFKAVFLDEEQQVAALGRDLRPIARLQQGLINSQQAMEREYSRLRQADTRYRVLFHVCSEGVLVVDGATQKVVEANPAAASLVGDSAQSIHGRGLDELFHGPSQKAIQSLVAGVAGGARPTDIQAFLTGQTDREMTVTASLFRQASTPVLLVRFWPTSTTTSSARSSRALTVLQSMPDGFVVTGPDRRILMTNGAFCELVHGNESQVVGEPLERWLGRPGVDLNIMLANLSEHGMVKNFATIIRSDFGAPQEALVTAVSALDGKVPCFGFTIRVVSSRLVAPPESAALPRSVDQLRELVGRVPLKDLVRESADLVERLCIEAALHVSGNNKASAAQLLGLSRQGFYSKLRRYGIADFSDDESDE